MSVVGKREADGTPWDRVSTPVAIFVTGAVSCFGAEYSLWYYDLAAEIAAPPRAPLRNRGGDATRMFRAETRGEKRNGSTLQGSRVRGQSSRVQESKPRLVLAIGAWVGFCICINPN